LLDVLVCFYFSKVWKACILVQPPNAPSHLLHRPLHSTPPFPLSPSNSHQPTCGLLGLGNATFQSLHFSPTCLLPLQPLCSLPPPFASPSAFHAPVYGMHAQVRLPSSVAACLHLQLCLIVVGFHFIFLLYFMFFCLLFLLLVLVFYVSYILDDKIYFM